ncbi:MAG: biopolymer transporter ExbD [Planctomycetaceae bacterium]
MKIKAAKPTIVEADMTPMIDMTFQLIAFFMMVSNLEQSQADERIKLPADRLARPPEGPREDEIVLNVGFRRANGEKTDEQAYVFYGDEDIPVLKYGPRLEREFSITERRDGKEAAEAMTVVIRADSDVPTGLIQELIKMGQEKGFAKFSLKAKSGEDE